MILADTSAWAEYLRATGGPVARHMRHLLVQGVPLATTEVVVMEVLAGARHDIQLQQLRRRLRRCELLSIKGLADYEAAAALYRDCRRGGETLPRLTDCLIAVVALRTGASILHAESAFDVLSRQSGLRIETPLDG